MIDLYVVMIFVRGSGDVHTILYEYPYICMSFGQRIDASVHSLVLKEISFSIFC